MFAPVLEIVPQLVPLQPEPVIDQLTDWSVLKQTVDVNVCCWPSETVAADGDMAIAGEQDDVIVMDAKPVWLELATLVATSVTGFAGGNDAGAV